MLYLAFIAGLVCLILTVTGTVAVPLWLIILLLGLPALIAVVFIVLFIWAAVAAQDNFTYRFK